MNLNQILTLSQQLIAIPSTKDKPDNLQKVLAVAKKHLQGFTVEEFNSDGIPSLLAYSGKTRPKRFKLILNGHTDVVAAKPEYFKGSLKGNRLTGRGAIDMKASVAALTLAFKQLAKKVNYPLALQLVTDEEVGGFNGTLHQIKQGVKADFVIAGEPTDLDLEVAAKGISWVKLTSKGKTAHGAYPWKGRNAIKIMTDNLQNISKVFPVPTKEAWKTTCNISVIQAGQAVNQVPDQCLCQLDIRRVPQESHQDILKKIRSACSHTTVSTVFNEPAHQTNLQHPSLKALEKSIHHHLNKKPRHLKKHGASDARHYAGANMSAICFGPKGDGLHSDNEWLDIPSLSQYYSILEHFILNL